MRKTYVLPLLAIFCLSTGVAAAQQPTGGEVQAAVALTRAQIQAERQAIVAVNMPLTDEQATAFWPVYRDYRNAVEGVGDRRAKLLLDYAASYESMTDEKAGALLKDWMSIMQQEAKVKADWVPRFSKILPATLVARFYQIENKLDTLINMELVDGVPLMVKKQERP